MDNAISPAVEEATKKYLETDETAKKIADLSDAIKEKELAIYELENKLSLAKKTRPDVTIKWRDSVKWCLEIDSKNFRYFLKSAAGVYKCIAFKHKVDITPDIRNKIATTLSLMFKEGTIGRILHNNTHYYGLKEFFNDDLTDLKDEFKKDIERLIS